jgi:hypothetical protein
MLRIGPYDLEFVCDRLRRFAAEYRAGGPAARYVLANGALVNERLVHADAGLMMRTLSQHRRLHTVELPFTAERVLVKSNIRIIGLGRRAELVAKLQLRHSPGTSLRREVRTNLILSRLVENHPELGRQRGFAIPRIVRSHAAGRWMIEERAPGAMATDAGVAAFLARYGRPFYALTARPRSWRPVDGRERLVAEAERLVPGVRMESGDHPAIFALCHGDLTTTNLMRDDGGAIWLVDFEVTRVMPLAFDLANTAANFPELAGLALAILRQIAEVQRVGSADQQFLLGLARAALLHADGFAQHVAGQVNLLGKTRDHAVRLHERKAMAIAGLARAVAGASASVTPV